MIEHDLDQAGRGRLLERTCPQCGNLTLARHTLPTRSRGGGWDTFEHCTAGDCDYAVERGSPPARAVPAAA